MIKTVVKALILHKKEIPPSHRMLTVLTQEHALLRVMVFGAATSTHGRSAFSSPYCLATLLLEQRHPHDPHQLVDGYDVSHFKAINLNLAAVTRAALWSEVAMVTEASGHDNRFFNLYNVLFQALDRAFLPLPMLDFLFYYYFLILNGVLPSNLNLVQPLHMALQQSLGMAMHYLSTHSSSLLPLEAIKQLFINSIPVPLKSLRLLEVYDDL
jgi:recombinational DNA repair protein (RecF pathway)